MVAPAPAPPEFPEHVVIAVVIERDSIAWGLSRDAGEGCGCGGHIDAPRQSKAGGGLQPADEVTRPGGEGGAVSGRDRLAGDELLAERIHELAVPGDPVVEVRAGRQARGA